MMVEFSYRVSSNSSRPSNRLRPQIDHVGGLERAKYSAPLIERAVLLKLTQSEQDQATRCLVGHILCNHRALLRHEDFQKLALLP